MSKEVTKITTTVRYKIEAYFYRDALVQQLSLIFFLPLYVITINKNCPEGDAVTTILIMIITMIIIISRGQAKSFFILMMI